MSDVKRHLLIGHLPALAVTKLVEVDVPKRFLYLEEMGDGTWRITCSKALTPVETLSLITIGRP